MSNIELYNEDCLKVLPTLKDNSVDLVLVDLPYGTTACKWDICIDHNEMWNQLKRIGKDDTAFIFFCCTSFGVKLIESNPKWFRYDLVWEKTKAVGFLNANKMPLRNHEMIYVFYKKLPTYNPQKTEGKPYVDKRNTTKDKEYLGLKVNREVINNTGDRHPTSVIRERKKPCVYGNKPIITTVRPNSVYKGWQDGLNPPEPNTSGVMHPKSIVKGCNNKKGLNHPTQKPVDLCEWLIKSYSNEGDTVLDFTMGSGSTGVACINTKRHFIGIEMDEKYFDIADKRMT